MSDLIEATSRQIRTMADGTLRLTVDIPPTSAQDAFKLFGAPDVPMVLARFNQEAAIKSAQDKVISEEKPKGGELARLAAMWCKDPKFWEWITFVCDYVNPIKDENQAIEWVRRECLVDSRAELDDNGDAEERFHWIIRKPYSEWLRTHG